MLSTVCPERSSVLRVGSLAPFDRPCDRPRGCSRLNRKKKKMTRLSRVLAGSTFRVWLYSIVLVLATTTMAIAAAFQDMYDWNVHEWVLASPDL